MPACTDDGAELPDSLHNVCSAIRRQHHDREACADMAGIKVMLRLAAENPDFDYDKFFRSYATLQQYDEFLDFYGITEGDGMYLAPEDRVAIW